MFSGALAGLCLVEVEFPSVEAAEAFTAPAWFGREVTGQPGWSNASLARYGRPVDCEERTTVRGRDRSGVGVDRPGRRGDVAAAELHGVDDQRGDLVQGNPVAPSAGERMDLVVGGEALVAEAAEQPHHRQVELTVAAVGGGIDQPALSRRVDEAIAGPQIAVQPGRRLVGGAELVEAAGECLQRRHGRRRQHVAGKTGEGKQPLRPVELGPRLARLVRQSPAAGRAPVLAAEDRRTGSVQGGEAATELRLAVGRAGLA